MSDRPLPADGQRSKPVKSARKSQGSGGKTPAPQSEETSGEGRPRKKRFATRDTSTAADLVATKAPRTIATSLGPRTVPLRPRGVDADGRQDRKVRPVLKLLNGMLTLLVMTMIGLGGLAYYLQAAVDVDGPLAEAKLLVIQRNDGTQQIAERLEKEGMVGDKRLFLAGLYTLRAATLMPGGRGPINLKAGEYEIKPGASIRSIIDVLSEGRSVLMRVTIPEGLTSYQIVERLKGDPSLSGDIREVPPEGALLPETYSVPRGSSRQSLIETMQAAQKKLLDQLWSERQEQLPFKSPAEALILASIVEKETGRNDERERVAAVFVNRLRKGMKIQSDPTILYGLALGKVQWGKTIFLSDKNSKTAHNTYVIPGLPPTPICNPGRAALEATMKPAAVNALFFVADGRGGHVFAETNREHEANVAKWRQIERERAGLGAAGAPTPVTTTINGPRGAPAAPTAPATLAPKQPAVKP